MGKIRIVECRRCGEKFETTSPNAKRCPDCRDKVKCWPGTPPAELKLRRQREAQRSSRDKRLKLLDEEYAALGVPVTTRVLPNGMVVETRGQARISSSCGIAPAMDSAIARKYL